MTDPQPIQTTAAVAHLRYTARRVAINERCVELQAEWLAADLIERQAAQIKRMRAALMDVRPLIVNLEKMLRDTLNLAGQPRSEDEAAAFARLHSALRMIDDAMGVDDASE
ncbi:hypothetical protein [Quisquiliibacterium transsilvanicum]|uniref:Uncharacterized protein n=1 Tax=Quisquiliibacterium transsilvanicum TaxID=1549638 RepID=A0A7W8HFX0_9BURK|nr:hypothetical protein [Quisquiliibacterium transsilvanicum]MBB5271369.1 hypothetical protein [Quisquiliibacterium transsilvanicum]